MNGAAPLVVVSNEVTYTLHCRRIKEDREFRKNYRAAAIEFIFQQVSPLVIQEAERQIGLLFNDSGGVAPSDLITGHIRWGVKGREMDLASIDEFLAAINQMLQLQGRSDNSTANIYLSSEDPTATREFLNSVPPGWQVYTDRMAELSDFRPTEGNHASTTTRNSKGRAGLVALGSLLVALEANYFVLTTGSNWSRLMNEARKNILDANCDNCTQMIDIRPGEWR